VTVVPFAEDPERRPRPAESLVVDLAGFEGPIDVLLQLARDQKVDVTKISILALAEQYLAFVREARRLRLELAADYLVMAAWLAYLKSKLLLPEPESEEERPSGAEMAAALRFQLQRLQAMQDRGAELTARPQLGRQRFARGCPEAPRSNDTLVYDVSLYDLLSAYGRLKGRQREGPGLRIVQWNLHSVEQAVRRLSALLGDMPGWHSLITFLPPDLRDSLELRSAVAATFVAGLELCRDGKAEIRQEGTFGPIWLRAREPRAVEDPAGPPEPKPEGEAS